MRHKHTQITQVHLCLWTHINIKLSFNGIIGALIINYLLFAVVFYAHVYFMLYCGFSFSSRCSSSTATFFCTYVKLWIFLSFVLLLFLLHFYAFKSHVKHEIFFSLFYWGKFSGKFVYTAIDTNHCHSIIHSCMLRYHMSIIEYRNWRKKKETFLNMMRVIYEILKANKWNEKIQQVSLG